MLAETGEIPIMDFFPIIICSSGRFILCSHEAFAFGIDLGPHKFDFTV